MFGKCLECNVDFRNAKKKKKMGKKFSVLEIIASEFVAPKCLC